MKHLTPQEAYDFLHKHPNALLVDVRSEMEYLFVGHPVGALHVAWNDGPDWDVNPHFVGQVKRLAHLSQRQSLRRCRRSAGERRLHRRVQRAARIRGRARRAAPPQLVRGLAFRRPAVGAVLSRGRAARQ
jgi:hypothetical protein